LVGEEIAIEVGVAAAGITAFVGAGVQQVSYALQPEYDTFPLLLSIQIRNANIQ
jgi:hypothetical protein